LGNAAELGNALPSSNAFCWCRKRCIGVVLDWRSYHFGYSGFINKRFGKVAAWTATAALLAGESLTISLSSGYVEWPVILYGWAALVSLDDWFETQDRKMLVICGILCGAAVGTKYTAGIILLGCLAALAFVPSKMSWPQRLSNLLVVGGLAVLVSSPWWLKNFLATGNPFYPFFFPAGAMTEFRLYHYQNVSAWGDWRSVILLPWQATIWGVESKDGFSASIGAILVGLSPLAWMGWHSRSEKQKTSIKVALILVLVGFLVWAVGSRVSGLLIQSRLFFGIFPAWALLAGAGMESVWKLKALNIRFGRVAAAMVLLMLGFNLFATWTDFTSRNPIAYLIRQEDRQRYLVRNMGIYAAAMAELNNLPPSSRVLMLWETRGFACWPRCDADEVIDRWYNEINTYQTPENTLQAWREQGYTHLLLFQTGADFIKERDQRYSKSNGKNWSRSYQVCRH
jgi:4-amino-4-deoxy-L-arabinose transferase-like glycosyltransferase